MKANPKKNYTYNYYSSEQPRTASSKTPKPKPRRGHKTAKLLVVLVIVVVGVLLIFHVSPKTKKTVSHDISKTISLPIKSSKTLSTDNDVSSAALVSMGDSINSIISANSNIDMSVSLIDLTSGQSEHYGDPAAFTAASTTKVITAADFLSEVQTGQQTLSETINGSSAEYEIQQMIVVSDDNAWDALNTQLGYSQLQSYADSVGVTSFQSEANTVTSNDMAHILDLLYKGQLLNSANTQLLLGYLKQANYREYIVPAVPSGDTIYHKIGLYEDNVNDEAIITDGNKAFVIVIFTNGNGAYNWPARATIMQQITKDALSTYF